MSFFTAAAWQKKQVGLKEAPRLPQCGKCGLFKTCKSPKMKPTGRGEHSILFVSETPGEQEDQKGVQLVGRSGQRLRMELKKLGVSLDACHKTNAVICHPPGNQIQDLHIDSCRPNLLKTIRTLKPTVIVLLGGSSVRSLMPAERDDKVGAVTRWVGWTIPSHEHQAWICPTYHPSFIERMDDPVLNRLFAQHLKRAVELEDIAVPGENLEVLKKQVDTLTSPRDARLRLKALARKKGVVAVDYENNRLKPDDPRGKIVACSFSHEAEDTFSFMVEESHHALMSKVLRNPALLKVASNLKHEERWTIARLGHRVRGWHWDTMLAAHTLDNRSGITGLKFQAFIHLGIADYDSVVSQYFEDTDAEGFNKVMDVPRRDLLLYNALDSLLEVLVMRRQRKAMGL